MTERAQLYTFFNQISRRTREFLTKIIVAIILSAHAITCRTAMLQKNIGATNLSVNARTCRTAMLQKKQTFSKTRCI